MEDLNLLANRLIEKNRTDYGKLGLSRYFNNLPKGNIGLKESVVGVSWDKPVEGCVDCGSLALDVALDAFKISEDSDNLYAALAYRVTDKGSTQNYTIFFYKDDKLLNFLESLPVGEGDFPVDLQRDIYKKIDLNKGIQVDATPWFEGTTSHGITGIHFVAGVSDINQKIIQHRKKFLKLELGGKEGLILSLGKFDKLWIESYLSIPIIGYANESGDLAYCLFNKVVACETVTSSVNISELESTLMASSRQSRGDKRFYAIGSGLSLNGAPITEDYLKEISRKTGLESSLAKSLIDSRKDVKRAIGSLPAFLEDGSEDLRGLLKLNHFLLCDLQGRLKCNNH